MSGAFVVLSSSGGRIDDVYLIALVLASLLWAPTRNYLWYSLLTVLFRVRPLDTTVEGQRRKVRTGLFSWEWIGNKEGKP